MVVNFLAMQSPKILKVKAIATDNKENQTNNR